MLQVPYYPPIESLDDYKNNLSRCLKLVKDAVYESEPSSSDIQIIDVNSWRMEAVVAEKYFSEDISEYSRVVLAGDSAHAFPPSGGFGLNTGIGDAFNLAHKLSKTLTARGIPLDQSKLYNDERKMIALLTKDFSLMNYEKSLIIAKKLNLDVKHAQYFTNLLNIVTPTTST